MNQKYIHILSILIILTGLVFITFLYWTEPRTIAEVSSKGQVALGTYEIDRAEFEIGLASFRGDEFPAARAAFSRADPQKLDAITQFYTAYSFYREGWGRVSNDDALFQAGLDAVDRVIELEPNFRISDDSLKMKTAYELRTELEEGRKLTISDLNPFKLTRERK